MQFTSGLNDDSRKFHEPKQIDIPISIHILGHYKNAKKQIFHGKTWREIQIFKLPFNFLNQRYIFIKKANYIQRLCGFEVECYSSNLEVQGSNPARAEFFLFFFQNKMANSRLLASSEAIEIVDSDLPRSLYSLHNLSGHCYYTYIK